MFYAFLLFCQLILDVADQHLNLDHQELIETNEMNEARKTQAEVVMTRSLQAVPEGAVTEAAQMELELLAQAKATEVAELHEAQREAERTG